MPYPKGLSLHTIWDEVAYLLDSRKDILSLALTCRVFKELVIPDHLEYRYIRCDPCRRNVWMFLCDRARLAKGIRSLEFIREAGRGLNARLPRTLSGPTGWTYETPRTLHDLTDKDLTMIRNSFSKMTSLKCFIWKQGLISSQAVFDILHTLTIKVQLLEELSIDLNELKLSGEQALLDNPSVWSLTNLTKVNLHDPVPAAIQMIVDCPNIQDLRLHQALEASILYMMQHSHWKKLRRLNFELDAARLALPAEDIPVIIISFFDHHPCLESLYFTLFNIQMPKLPSTYFPKLRSAGSTYAAPDEPPSPTLLTLTSFLSDDTISHLVHWQIPIHDVDINALPQLESLTHAFCDFQLQLDFSQPRNYNISLSEAYSQKLEPLYEKLATSQTIKYLRVMLDWEYRFVRLERHEDGLYSGYKFVTPEEVGEFPHHWENPNFFFGVFLCQNCRRHESRVDA
ncbi:hypothetical protein Clacol_007058 [Clathrus columnatus]|uniref:F-box domain-containing protein n=1 Tax=Clathrus columnatus TaxID=1419009 RepID=A0AAV5AH43_9AGAM|nr:hypothetical protein Clacol_007058 [Clathrus columnatus]